MMDKYYQRIIRDCTAFVMVALYVSVLGGCVLSKNIQKSKTEAPKEGAAQKGDAPQLDEGLDGFIIKEVAKMDSATRSDFDRSVEMLNDAQYDEAIKILEKIIEKALGITAPHINLGMAYQFTEKTEKAEAQFKKALELMPGHPAACNQYGLLCRKAGRFEEARAIYENALADYPNYYPVHRNLGILCDLYLNDPESALRHYETYSQAMPDDAQVKLWIADIKARLGTK